MKQIMRSVLTDLSIIFLFRAYEEHKLNFWKLPKTFLVIVVGLLVVEGHCQTAAKLTREGGKSEELPRLKDWFLSTGDWENDPQLYVREFGTGKETIIMLHGGWGAEHSGLINAVKDLENDYRFVFYDQRGSLRSPFPDSLITFHHHIEDLELLRKELDLSKLKIVGHSMGAVLAGAYASKYPMHIEKLVLLAPAQLKNPVPDIDKELQQQEYLSFQEFYNRSDATRELEKYGLTGQSALLSSRGETSKARINFAKRMLYDLGKWATLTGGRALYKDNVFPLTAKTYPKEGWDYIEQFKNEGYPVGIIIGDHDFLDFGNQLISKWIKDVPNIKLTIIKNGGHMIWIDEPDKFSHELRAHLKN